MEAHKLHRGRAPKSVGFFIITASTSRFRKRSGGAEATDESGDLAERMVRDRGHTVVGRELVADDARMLRRAFRSAVAREAVDVVLFTGGTGISPTDMTVDVIRPYFEKELVGFGEALRSASLKKIGSAAMLSRATAGIGRGRLILCLPGSPDGVKTALDIFLGDVPHVVYVARG